MANLLSTKTVRFEGTFAGRLYTDWVYIFTLPGAVASTSGLPGTGVCFTITGPFGSFIRGTVQHGPSGGSPNKGQTIFTLDCATGLGETDTDTVIDEVSANGTTEADFTNGTWSIEIDCNYLFSLSVGANYPTYGGAAANDPPKVTAGQTLLRSLVGGEIRVEASVAGATVSASHTFTALEDSVVTRAITSAFYIQEGQGAGSISTQIEIDGEPVFSEYFVTGSFNVADARSGNYVYVSDDSGGLGTPNFTSLSATHYPSRSYNASGVVRAMEGDYPNSLTILVDRASDDLAHEIAVTGGAWTDSNTQHRWSAEASFKSGSQGAESVNEQTPFRAYLKDTGASSLESNGEPVNHWRSMIRAFWWGAMTIKQGASLQIAGAHTGLTSGSNSFTVPDGSTSAGAEGTHADYTGKASFQYGRFCRFRLRHDDSGTETLSSIGIGSKTWSRDYMGNSLAVPTGSGYTSITLDLCDPDGSETESKQSTKYPHPITADWAWGVNAEDTIELNGIGGGVTWDVQDVFMVRHDDDSRVTILQGCENFVDESASTTAELGLNFFQGRTNERISLEGIGFYRVGSVYTERPIVDLIGSINGAGGAFPADGWEATDLIPMPGVGCSGTYPDLRDCLLNSDRPAFELQGNGALYRSSAWEYGFDLDASATRTLRAQILLDSMEWEGGFGDVFGIAGGASTGDIEFRCATILDAQEAGLVFLQSQRPAPGVNVEIDGGTYGQGTTAAGGAYQTGLPYVPGGVTAEVSADVGATPPSVSETFFTRWRGRACFRVALVEGAVIYNVYEDRLGMLHAVGVDSGNIKYYRSNSSLPIPNWAVNGVSVTSAGTDDNPTVVRNWQGRVFVLFDRAGSTYETYSDDDGETWSTPAVAISGGTRPHTRVDSQGNHIETAYLAGNIAARFRAAGDTSWSSVFTFTDNTGTPLLVEDMAFSFDDAHDAPARWVLGVVIDGETETSLWWSADEGRTSMSWTRVT